MVGHEKQARQRQSAVFSTTSRLQLEDRKGEKLAKGSLPNHFSKHD